MNPLQAIKDEIIALRLRLIMGENLNMETELSKLYFFIVGLEGAKETVEYRGEQG